MFDNLREKRKQKKIEKAIKLLNSAFGIDKDLNYTETHRNHLQAIDMLYVELSKRFHELGALHEDDEDLVLHERYHKKGIFYEMKHREAVASNYIEGIYQVIRGIEEDVYLQVMQIQLQEVQEDLKEIDEHYKNIWSKIK